MNMRYSLFRYISVVVVLCTLVSCSLEESGDVMYPETPPASGPKPTIPIKRRPIVPGTQLPRPRIIIRVDGSLDRVMSLDFGGYDGRAEVELWSKDMNESWSTTYFGDGSLVEFIVDADATQFMVSVTTDEGTYSEIVEL